ncbi:MAG TPA: hypothetical protein VHO01_12970 [Jatrophihabitans sp.]|nr:hypothetical protein [Jatrophihabitans sp.]
MSGSVSGGRWRHRLMLLALALGGLWLLGLWGHSARAEAAPQPGSAPVVAPLTGTLRAVLDAARSLPAHAAPPAANATPAPPAALPRLSRLAPATAGAGATGSGQPTAATIVQPVVTGIVQPVVTGIVQPVVTGIVQPVLAGAQPLAPPASPTHPVRATGRTSRPSQLLVAAPSALPVGIGVLHPAAEPAALRMSVRATLPAASTPDAPAPARAVTAARVPQPGPAPTPGTPDQTPGTITPTASTPAGSYGPTLQSIACEPPERTAGQGVRARAADTLAVRAQAFQPSVSPD